MPKILINKVEFYITNVCNLTCEYCNRFNNLNFKGWQDWSTYADIYAQWSKLLDIKQVVIMGGEPLLNPSICDWAKGLGNLWKTSPQILSNGTRINYVKGFYDLLKSGRAWLGVTIHNINQKESIIAGIKNFLQAPVTKIEKSINDIGDQEIDLRDKNGITVMVSTTSMFLQNAIIKDQNNNWTLHNTDPEESHRICVFAQSKSYHFIKGKFYKCGPVALLPDLDQQITLNISQEDRQLLHSYQPLTLENFDQYHKEFFSNLDNPIPQCKFCPSYGGGGKIFPIEKKNLTV